MMWWHGELWTIAAVESLAKRVMGNHDFQPRHKRDQANGIIGHFKGGQGIAEQKAAIAEDLRTRPQFTLTFDKQMTRKPNLALNAEIESSGRAANGTGNN
jgi:hypothetical protein